MFKFKMLKTFFFAASLSLLIAGTAHAGSYTVESNDSLYKIGSLFGTTSTNISQLNNLQGTTLYPGQVIKVPCSMYTVKSGDSLYLIAKKSTVTLYSLRKANNKWNDYVYAGQMLNLPARASAGSTAAAVVSYTASDLDLLARLITAEAGNQPYTAKVGVGAVVVNRVQDASWPNTISGVIYQKTGGYYQFSPVENGWINKPASQDAKNAAYEAIHGSDPTNGALYYFDDSTTNKWIWSKPIALRSGNMVYSY
jgi:spore germination cell wall hydrolase CwlJ-like protein